MEKENYLFKLGCTSYVFPGNILFNVPQTGPFFDDIELVLFESSDICNFPENKEIQDLYKLGCEYDLTYTVHLPTDKKAGSYNQDERRGFIDQISKLVELTKPLKPYGYILHLEGIERNASPFEKTSWRKNVLEVCQKISEMPGLEREKVCVENLNYPIKWHEYLVEQFGFSYCLDFGHLFLYQENWQEIADTYLDKTRVIHLHGVSQGKDHISIKQHDDKNQMKEFGEKVLNKFNGVVTIETFCEKDTFEGLLWVRELVG